MTLSLAILAGFEMSLGSKASARKLAAELPQQSVENEEPVAVEADTTAVEPNVDSEPIAETVKVSQKISKFDTLMRKVGGEMGYDWRFVSAIAYCESRFKEGLVSKRGATGLMQIMPIVARHFKVPQSHLHNTEANVRLACRLLAESESQLDIPESTPESDRLCILLASYNAGLGHVKDARRLAEAEGENPNSWAVVSKYLKLKATPAYYNRKEVKAGRFAGSKETLHFVELAMSQYAHYCEIAW